MPTFIKDLFDLPDVVRGGDFVLRLAEGLERPEQTLRDYVVTPQLARGFDDALSLVRDALGWRPVLSGWLHRTTHDLAAIQPSGNRDRAQAEWAPDVSHKPASAPPNWHTPAG